MQEIRIAFLGAGSMGTAVLRGLLSKGHPVDLLSASTSSEASARKLREAGVSAISLEADSDANLRLIQSADVVILGVKPYQLVEVLQSLKPHWRTGQQIISMAAGVTLDTLRALVPRTVNVVRTMPNTPSQVGRGVTGLVSEAANDANLRAARYIFGSVGAVIECPESQLDWLSAVSGSGPAYVFYLIENLEQIARDQGFTEPQSQTMVRETIIGAMNLLEASQLPPEELRRRVTSPNGTTERAINHFDESGLPQTLQAGLEKAVARAAEIAEEQRRKAELG